MKIKDNTVSLNGLQLPMRKVLKVVDKIYKSYGQEAVITAGTEVANADGKFVHSAGSFHPFGFALDFRTRYFILDQIQNIKIELEEKLGDDYDVIFEVNHFHIEYDPKGI